MKIIVTGSEGQIGRELLPLLSGHEVLAIDKKSGNNLNDKATQFKIREFEADGIIHLAASFERTVESPEFAKANWEDNILATHNLLESTSARHIVFASSYLTYNPVIYMNPKPVAIYEEAPVGPRNLCGASKLYLEKAINFWAKFREGRACHARIFRVYSNHSDCFINQFYQKKKAGEIVNVWNGSGSFDFIHARDVARALYALYDADVMGVYNVGTGVSNSVDDVVRLLGVTAEKAIDFAQTEKSVAAIGKIKSVVGWEPKISLEEGIKELCI